MIGTHKKYAILNPATRRGKNYFGISIDSPKKITINYSYIASKLCHLCRPLWETEIATHNTGWMQKHRIYHDTIAQELFSTNLAMEIQVKRLLKEQVKVPRLKEKPPIVMTESDNYLEALALGVISKLEYIHEGAKCGFSTKSKPGDLFSFFGKEVKGFKIAKDNLMRISPYIGDYFAIIEYHINLDEGVTKVYPQNIRKVEVFSVKSLRNTPYNPLSFEGTHSLEIVKSASAFIAESALSFAPKNAKYRKLKIYEEENHMIQDELRENHLK